MPPKIYATAEERRLANVEKARRYREKHPERVRERSRIAMAKKRAEDPEAANAVMRAWNAANRKKINQNAIEAYYKLKERRAVDPELDAHLREITRANSGRWRKKHPEKQAAASKQYAMTHKDTINSTRRARNTKHPEKIAAQNAKRRALVQGAPINDFTAEQWTIMKEVYHHRCAYCGKKSQRLTQDHITPLSKGGSHTLSNIVPACRSCNGRKGAGEVLIPIQPLLLA
jgi:5-methylcytosine-specific restriction endonuclease McrA